MEEYYIRGFRDDEWKLLRDKRLEALKSDSGVFLRNYDAEAAYGDERWINVIRLKDGKVFGLWHGVKLIGITGVFRDEHDASGKSAKLGMSYIERAYRGRGLSRLLYEARIEWARANGFERIIVSHRDGNEVSRRANAAFGFKWYASEEITYGDGNRALDHRYELKL